MNAVVDVDTGEISRDSSLALALPSEPMHWPTVKLVSACEEVYLHRAIIVGSMTVDDAAEALRRARAIQNYVRDKSHKVAANRAARVLETAVGEALGKAQHGGDKQAVKQVGRDQLAIDKGDKARFRLMSDHRDSWWPKLEEVPLLSRKQALELIDRARHPDDDSFDVSREHCTADDLHLLATRIAEGNAEPFGTIYADPPWQYGNQGTRASNEDHYNGESVEWLCDPANMPVAHLAAPNAHLHLWTTNAFLFEAHKLMEAWGFTYKSCYVWVKPQIGMGNYWRVSHEFLLLGVRGSMSFATHNLKSWGEFKRRQHSAKPEEIRELIHVASPGPRLELFARRSADGWTSWGNEIERNIFHSGGEDK